MKTEQTMMKTEMQLIQLKRQLDSKIVKNISHNLKADLQSNKKLIFYLAKTYRKGRTDKANNVKYLET